MNWNEVINKYLTKGFSVFPVVLTREAKIQKKPLVEWQDYQHRLATQDEVDVWCSMLSFNALGMATGKVSGITVIDVDDPTITQFDSPVKVRTISGGFHLWYKYKPGVRNMARVNHTLVDIRGDGGFVVIPPSSLGDAKYTWESSDFDNLPEFPAVVQHKEEYKPKMTTLPQASDGSRNQTAIQVAGHMVSNTREQAWETTAWEAFRNWNQMYVSPPLDDFELRRTFDSACHMEKVNHPSSDTPYRIITGENITLEHQKTVEKWGYGLTTGYPMLDEYFTFLPEQLYLVSAPTHEGKTTFTLNMAAKIASFNHNVLFCSLEQGIFIAPRIKTLLGGDVPPTLSIMDVKANLKISTLVNAINSMSQRPELVVIDHLDFIASDDTNGYTRAVDRMINEIQNAAKELELPIMVISHLRKLNENKAPRMDDLRNSSQLSQVPSVVLMMKMDENEEQNTIDSGVIYLRKNRLTGKKAAFNYQIALDGSLRLDKYIYKKLKLEI